MSPLRIGIVNEIDLELLWRGLSESSIREDFSPVRVESYDAARDGLLEGGLDVALVSPLAAAEHRDRLVVIPGIGASCRGTCPALQLLLFSRLEHIESCASTSPGHAAMNVAQLVFHSTGREVRFEPFDGDAEDALGEYDSVVVTGDSALCEEAPEEATSLDLGQAWSAIGTEALVWSLAATVPGRIGMDRVARLQQLATDVRDRAESLAGLIAEDRSCARSRVLELLVDKVRYRLESQEAAGVAAFFDSCELAGLLEAGRRPTYLKL